MDKLDQAGHYTVFAPTNEAFDKLSPGYLNRIMEDKAVIAGTCDTLMMTSQWQLIYLFADSLASHEPLVACFLQVLGELLPLGAQ